MRFIISLFHFFFFFCCAFAYDVEIDGICYNLLGMRYAYVTHRWHWSDLNIDASLQSLDEATGYVGDVVVPDHITYNGNTYTVRSVSENAFAWSEGLTSVRLPSTVRAVSACAFLGCTNLRQVYMSPDFRAIAPCAFTGCTSLQQITLPRAADVVDTLTFYCCSSLTSIALPHRIRTVCQGALEHLSAMTDLYSFASTPPVAEQGVFTLADQQHCTLHVPAEALSLYQQSPVWSDFCQIVPLTDDDYLSHNYQRGDINADGVIDAEDLLLLRRIIVSLPTDAAVRWAADVNADGTINAIDYVTLARQLGSIDNLQE